MDHPERMTAIFLIRVAGPAFVSHFLHTLSETGEKSQKLEPPRILVSRCRETRKITSENTRKMPFSQS